MPGPKKEEGKKERKKSKEGAGKYFFGTLLSRETLSRLLQPLPTPSCIQVVGETLLRRRLVQIIPCS